MNRPLCVSVLLFLLPAGCLENREEIAIRADGSVNIAVSVRGDVPDLEEGHSIPFEGPWRPIDAGTRAWRAGERPAAGDERKRVTLQVEAEFPSVDALPRGYAPAAEPYPDAYQQRSASLQILHRGARTVYVFERRFHARVYRAWDAARHWESAFTDELQEKFERWEDPTVNEWRTITQAVRGGFATMAEAVVREACAGGYLTGDRGLAVADLERIAARCRSAATAEVPQQRLVDVYAQLRRIHQQDIAGAPNPLAQLESDVERAVRDTLVAQLAAVGCDAVLQNRIRTRFEWCLTHMHHTADLQDENFLIDVEMPGVVVSGNWDRRLRSDTVHWEFGGDDLRDRDVVLRAVSVVE